MTKNIIFFTCAAALAAACAATVPRGVIAMKVSRQAAQVTLGEREVRPGDLVTVYRNICKQPPAGAIASCRLERLGNGNISQTIDARYSMANFPAGVEFAEGDIVERQ